MYFRPQMEPSSGERTFERIVICFCLPPDRTWGQITRWSDYRLGKRRVGPEPWLEPCWSMLVIGSLCAIWTDELCWTWTHWWVQALMPDYCLNWTTGVQCYTKVSIMQLAHPKVAKPKPGTFRPQVCLKWSVPRPTRMPGSPSKKPVGVKANSKLMQSALSPGRDIWNDRHNDEPYAFT